MDDVRRVHHARFVAMVRRAGICALIAAMTGSSSCTERAPARNVEVSFTTPVPTALPSGTESVVVVALDGTRWQDIALPETMPTLHRWAWIDGANLADVWASGPNYVSLPGYNEIFAGITPDCQSNECDRTSHPTIADLVRIEGQEVGVISSWEKIDRAASTRPESIVLSTGRHRAEHLDHLDRDLFRDASAMHPYPGLGDFRPDAQTGRIAIDYLQTRHPKFLFIGFGEPDEYGHQGNKWGYIESLRAADRFLAALEEAIDERTTVFVTADHGRSEGFRDHGQAWPESGRVFLIAKGGAITARGRVGANRRHFLRDIAPTIRALLDLAPDDDPRAGQPITELF